MSLIRVLVVEDSLTVRRQLVEILLSDPEFEVVGEAADGRTAIEMVERFRPDVITLDMMLPVMTGVAVTEYVMAYHPTPILIVSASMNRGDVYRTYDALAAGALDVLEKPKGNEPEGVWEKRFIDTVKLVSRVRVITHVRGRLGFSEVRPEAHWPFAREGRLVAIGGSTGGPGALMAILKALPRDFPAPIVVVIHIGGAFGTLLADWLDGHSELEVRCARDGDPLPERGEGRVLLAPAGYHLVVWAGRLRLTRGAERHSCRPSVDVLFESVAEEIGDRGIGCLLTGMGRDGAHGLLEIRRAGGRTIAQDEATSTVFGMPKEAIALGAAELVLPLNEIAPALMAWTARRDPRGWEDADSLGID